MTTTMIDTIPTPNGRHDEFSGLVSTGDPLTYTFGAKVGDVIEIHHRHAPNLPAGTRGRVIKVDHGSVYPVVVWFENWAPPERYEVEAESGYPLAGHEFRIVNG